MKRLSNKMAKGCPDEPLVWCPGCECLHRFNVNKPNEITNAIWTWDGDTVNPTFNPSIVLSNSNGRGTVCHAWLKNGVWEYLGDCTHALVGQKVLLPDLPDWVK